MAPAVLNTPPEILHVIFAPLSPSDLYAVCLTRGNWRSVAEPLLYDRVEWTWTNSQNPPIAQFLRSIVHRPELASLVHAVILNGDCFENSANGYEKKSPKLPVSEDALDELVQCVERIPIPYGEKWVQELRAGTMDAFTALLLSRLPNLRYLYLGTNFARESRILGMMLRSALCEEPQDSDLPSFTHLRDVSAVYPCPGRFIRKYTDERNTADALPFFYLPSAEQIRILVDNPTTFMWPGGYPPNSPRLLSLDLTMLREGHLGQVLSATPGLRKLRWDWYYRPDLEDRFVTDIIDLDQIAADISQVQETLTELTITAGSDVSLADPELPTLTFRGFPIPFLLGFSPSAPNVVGLKEALPKNVQWLTVTDDLCFQYEWEWYDESESLFRAFRSWLQDCKKSMPRLQGFCLLMKVFKVREWEPELIQGLRDMGVQEGIRIEIVEERTKWAGKMEP
ncbi:hypothetical protein BDV38DRAFT_289911 [Aspergillus pseudotamarii]|uniref:F-box domain-containing protein n=1 Tax=Aspergillus pseudotamarii TaxID=132259 RepID=A0A5N6T3G1_ASPPS|nr:uncharacterized protein BDV38DRAFT_289911 [Aspergillus pseudotamarii]KAE8140845.1 hypothetical protein BDV38DRAFT_289911 [Aspergillus pseudotamarii]